MPWYKTGTVSVTQNSNAVSGTGTAFIANSRVGDAFRGPDGGWYEVTNIASDTAMSIAPNYQGVTNAAGVYALAPMQGYVKDSADALRALVNQFGGVLAVLGNTPTLEGVRHALNLTTADGLPEGEANKYLTNTGVLSVPLTGVDLVTTGVIVATDTILKALGKLQASKADASRLSNGWAVQPLGVPVGVLDNLTGVTAPPTNDSYRYIKLTASDAYNAGVLASESVSGSAPLVLATAVISLVGSPLNGQTVSLINTERRVLRAGSAGTLEQDALQDHRHPQYSTVSGSNTGGGVNGVAASGSLTGYTGGPIENYGGAPRVANETRVKSIGVTYYMRIK